MIKFDSDYNLHLTKGRMLDPDYSKYLLLETKKVLDKAGITFWLHFGTLLGAHRDKAFIPWDCDVDIALHEADKEKVMILMEAGEFRRKGLLYFRNDVLEGRGSLVSLCYETDYLDMNFYEKVEDRYYCHAHYTEASQIDTLSEIDFLGETFKTVNDIELYLTRYDNWRVPSPQHAPY